MKILHSIGSFVNGGIETLLINVVNRFAVYGHSVAIMIVTDKWDQDMVDALDARVRVFYINKPVGSKNPWYLLKMLYYYKTFNADILHLHSPGSERFFFPKNQKERRIVTIHNETIPMMCSSSVDCYIAISECVREAFKIKTGSQNCLVCYNGVDIEKFRVKSSCCEKPHKIVALGRVLFNVKAQDLIVQALSRLPKDIQDDMHLDVVGEGRDLGELKVLIQELKMEDKITLIGNVSNAYIKEHLCDYDLLLCASHHEGLGITAIEGMVSGVPLLLSDTLGYLEVTENGKYGIHFKCSDVDAMRDAIVYAYDNYPAMCKLSEFSKEYARQKFSVENYVRQIFSVYTMS